VYNAYLEKKTVVPGPTTPTLRLQSNPTFKGKTGKIERYPSNHEKQLAFLDWTVDLVLEDSMPFSTVDKPGFRTFVSRFDEKIQPRSRRTLKRRIDQRFDAVS